MRSRTRKGRTPPEAGFTLLELMLSVTILSVLAALTLGAFQLGQDTWARGDAAIEDHGRLRVAAQRMLRQISAATDAAPAALDAAAPVFEGDSGGLRFISAAALAPGGDRGLVAARYTVRGGASGAALDFTERPLAALAPGEDPFDPQGDGVRLLDGLDGLGFSYFRPGRDGAVGAWRSAWPVDGATGLPAAVRVTITPRGGAPLDMIARLCGPSTEAEP